MTSASLWLARLTAIASRMSVVASCGTEVLLEGTVLQFLWHPGLDMLVKLAAVDATLLALSLSDYLPCGLERVGTEASSVERHLGTMDSTIDYIQARRSKTETTRVDLIEVAEDFELKLRG